MILRRRELRRYTVRDQADPEASMNRRLALVLLLTLTAALAACGTKGALVLPDQAAAAKKKPATSQPPPPSADAPAKQP
jgi:predicted small lipoprotein YifL